MRRGCCCRQFQQKKKKFKLTQLKTKYVIQKGSDWSIKYMQVLISPRSFFVI